MSIFRSWLPNRPLRTSYELPLWQDELDASTIPPPIVASRVLSPPRRSVSPPPSTDEMGVLRHKEKELQQTLQELLDAQAEGLMAGLGRAAADDVTSNGSLTPTISSVRSQTHSPAPPIRRRKLGLRGARRALYRTIHEYSKLKEQESKLIQSELDHEEEVLSQLNDWEERRTGLQKEMGRISQRDTEQRKRALAAESAALHAEIAELELRLSQLRNRHRLLQRELATLDNAVQSQLSSYKSSLALLDASVAAFLARPPAPTAPSDHADADADTFLALPPARRTLDMARDHWSARTAALAARRAAAVRDRAALDDGAVVWRRVVEDVASFERFLRAETGRLAARVVVSGKGKVKGEGDDGEAAREVLRKMDGVIATVDGSLGVAVAKRWKLLEVCIGAELEALRQGRDVLEEAFGLADEGGLDKTVTDPSVAVNDRGLGSISMAAGGLDGGTQQKMYDTDDDGPDEQIMFSRVKANGTGL